MSIPGHANLPTSNTLLAAYAGLDGVKTGHTDEATALAASLDPPVAAAALNEAFGKSVNALVPWTSDTIGKASATSPVSSTTLPPWRSRSAPASPA